MTVGDLLAGCGLALPEARTLLALALELRREALIADPQRPVETSAAARFGELCGRRRLGEPMAYLCGEREFFGRPFAVDPSVLIPRPETESLVEAALGQLEGVREPRVLDVGTGSGCVAITLALERIDSNVVGTDVCEAALQLARRNGLALSARVQWLLGDWFAPVKGRFDLIVSNPPYVAANDPHLAELRFEPREALTDGGDGLGCLRALARQAGSHLADDGVLLVEHGYDQAAAVRELMDRHGFGSVRTLKDLSGLDRVCLARKR